MQVLESKEKNVLLLYAVFISDVKRILAVHYRCTGVVPAQ